MYVSIQCAALLLFVWRFLCQNWRTRDWTVWFSFCYFFPFSVVFMTPFLYFSKSLFVTHPSSCCFYTRNSRHNTVWIYISIIKFDFSGLILVFWIFEVFTCTSLEHSKRCEWRRTSCEVLNSRKSVLAWEGPTNTRWRKKQRNHFVQAVQNKMMKQTIWYFLTLT